MAQIVRRTEMPTLCADRRDPPTASTCQPTREREKIRWMTMASTPATTTEKGRPKR